jgi:hypothetical protein
MPSVASKNRCVSSGDDRHEIDRVAAAHRVGDEVDARVQEDGDDAGIGNQCEQAAGRSFRADGRAPCDIAGRTAPGSVAGEAAQARPDTIGADQQEAAGLHQMLVDVNRCGDAVRMHGEVLHGRAQSQLDVGVAHHLGGERCLQVGPVDHQIGRTPAPFAEGAERHAGDGVERLPIEKDHGLGFDRRECH